MKYLVQKNKFEYCKVYILPHKETGKYSFVNITKGHICPCVFDTYEDALKDLEDRKEKGLIDNYWEIQDYN